MRIVKVAVQFVENLAELLYPQALRKECEICDFRLGGAIRIVTIAVQLSEALYPMQ
jgi:hypothetical protein